MASVVCCECRHAVKDVHRGGWAKWYCGLYPVREGRDPVTGEKRWWTGYWWTQFPLPRRGGACVECSAINHGNCEDFEPGTPEERLCPCVRRPGEEKEPV